jgi:hypothetical protein
MAQQSNLEKKGTSERQIELVRNDIKKNEPYSPTHPDAISHPDDPESSHGKGTGHGGHTYFLPDPNGNPNLINYSNFDTFNGGSGYDIYGRNDIGGRKKSMTINIYNQDNAYGLNSVDTTKNIIDGQYVVS